MPVADFPNISPGTFSMINRVPTIINRTLSGRETRTIQQTPRFVIAAEYNTQDITNRRLIEGHVGLASGPLNDFDLNLPVGYKDTQGDITGTIETTSGASAGATSIGITTPSFSSGTALKAGDYIRFNGQTKVYIVTEDVAITSNAGTMNIFPALQADIGTGIEMDFNDVQIRVRYNADIEHSVRASGFSDIEIEFIEVV